MHQPVQSFYPHNNILPQTNRSLPIPCSSPPQSSVFPLTATYFSSPHTNPSSSLIALCFRSAFAAPSSSLHPFFIPSFPFLEALAQEELTKGFIKGEYTANPETKNRKVGVGLERGGIFISLTIAMSGIND